MTTNKTWPWSLAVFGAGLLAATGAGARDPADCTGLVPAALPAPVDINTGDSSKILCGGPSVDGGGTIVIGRTFFGGQGAGDQLYFNAAGVQVANSTLFGVQYTAEQPSGFLAFTSENSPDYKHSTYLVRGLSPDGQVLATTTIFDGLFNGAEQHQFVPDPRGGGAAVDTVLVAGVPANPDPWEIRVRLISTTGATTSGPVVIDSGPRLVPRISPVISFSGDLALFTSGVHFSGLRNNQLVARWFDSPGAALTPWFPAIDQVDADWPGFSPDFVGALPDGSIAVQRLLRGASVQPRSTSVAAPPDWLPVDATDFVVLADRIAVIRAHDTPCNSEIEIRAPAGNRCGSIAIPAGTINLGGPKPFCLSTLTLHVGRDGTVIRSSPGTDNNRCAYRSWPHLLH